MFAVGCYLGTIGWTYFSYDTCLYGYYVIMDTFMSLFMSCNYIHGVGFPHCFPFNQQWSGKCSKHYKTIAAVCMNFT